MKIAVLGAGHMGAWLVNELAKEHEVCIYDTDFHQTETIRHAFILSSYSDLRDFNPDILINAVSLQNTIKAFERAAPFLSQSCLLTDVASVKGRIPEYYKKCGFPFVSCHPMFGPTFANVRQLEEENAILIKESDPGGAQFFNNFFRARGLNIYECSFEEHDEMIAYSLTLPFASSMVFAACLTTSAVPGTTFKKHHEIAKGLLSEDDYLLSEILFNSHSLLQLEKITGRLEFLKHVIRQKDLDEARKFFAQLRENIQNLGQYGPK